MTPEEIRKHFGRDALMELYEVLAQSTVRELSDWILLYHNEKQIADWLFDLREDARVADQGEANE